jgi:cytochrome c oxidase subunit 4
MSEHVTPVKTYINVFVILLVLLVATVGAANMPLGHFHLATAMLIAGIKAVLIGLFFMHIYHSPKLTWIVSTGSAFFLALLLAFLLNDYLTRDWLDIPGK